MNFNFRQQNPTSHMNAPKPRITYIGGPTCLLEFGGVRLLTDPTFDPAGGEYTTGPVTLRKLAGPAIIAQDLGPIDYVLLSHDHHSDNLDHAGRRLLAKARGVLTTCEGARRLGGNSLGLNEWQSADLPTPDGRTLRVVATPGRHGPDGLSRGAVTGFALFHEDTPEHVIYISGDTVWYQGVVEIGRRFSVRVAILNLGAARVPEVGPFHLTMTAEEGVLSAHAFANAVIIPLHFEDWAHFSEGRSDIECAFANAHLEHRIVWPQRGRPIEIDCSKKLMAEQKIAGVSGDQQPGALKCSGVK
jgi:L-ascorbate metabolism protein UlaG (beta-lactamase superfamily)